MTNFLKKKILITLDSDSIFSQKVNNFIQHYNHLNQVLPDLIRESNQKIAARDLKAVFVEKKSTLVETATLSNYDPHLR